MSAPPTAEELTAMMQGMLIEDPEQNAMIFLGADDQDIVMPCTEHPTDMLAVLGELFEAGDPRVKEAILVMCLAPDGPSYTKQQTYTRTADSFDWDEVRDMPTKDMGGAIANGMRRVLGMDPVTR